MTTDFNVDGNIQATGNITTTNSNLQAPDGSVYLGANVVANIHIFANGNIYGNDTLFVPNIASSGNLVVGQISTDNYTYANGDPVPFTANAYGDPNVAVFLPTYTGVLAGSELNLSNTSITIGANTGTGTNIVAVGNSAGAAGAGANSVSVGQSAGSSLAGANAVLIGAGAGATHGVLAGQNMVAIGAGAGGTNQGSNSVAIGYQAGDNLTSGSKNIIIGTDIDAPSATTDNQLNIGNIIFGTGVSGTGSTIAGLIGIGTTSPGAQLQVTSTASGTIGSIIKGATSQSANLAEWQNSSATVLASISSGGNLTLPSTGLIGFTGGTAVTTSNYSMYGDGSANTLLNAPTGGAIRFRINNADKVIVDSSGRLGIGVSSPSTLLHVGEAGTTLGTLGLAGNTSGLVTIQPAAAQVVTPEPLVCKK